MIKSHYRTGLAHTTMAAIYVFVDFIKHTQQLGHNFGFVYINAGHG